VKPPPAPPVSPAVQSGGIFLSECPGAEGRVGLERGSPSTKQGGSYRNARTCRTADLGARRGAELHSLRVIAANSSSMEANAASPLRGAGGGRTPSRHLLGPFASRQRMQFRWPRVHAQAGPRAGESALGGLAARGEARGLAR